ncbi:hypothetical protein C8F04DRAFT_227277 [Mycena alexandri]|uniref:Uncharacterized protein n=1 Tax=Mycena alexandri TaxID=1745969 RepID=A0AAD6T7T6_9AGAR|nr:hypothetical protein C8F04DRAFT_227277 [Mycena alexandri]
MHRSLEILEIREHICAHLTRVLPPAPRYPGDTGTDMTWRVVGGPALAALASTCHLFEDPALDVLWRTQSTLVNFLRCFPEDVLLVEGSQYRHQTHFLRAITPSDWERPRFYAQRIRHFSLQRDLFLNIPEIPSALRLGLVGHVLFPRLQLFSWHFTNPRLEPYIDLFLGPHVTSLTTTVSLSDAEVSLILPIAPQLKHANIISRRELASSFARSLLCIESLCISEIDSVAWQHIGSLPSLKSLDLTYMTRGVVPSLHPTVPLFIGLEKLNLASSPITTVSRILTLVSSSPIIDLQSVNGGDPHEFFTTIAAHCSHATLAIFGHTFRPAAGDNYAIRSPAIRVLFPFGNLTEMKIISDMAAFDLDDDMVLEMASAWPQIVTLVLKVSAGGYAGTHPPAWLANGRPRFTLAALAHLAHRCPSLQTLELTVDATVIPSSWEPCAQTALTALHVGHSPITETAISPVATFIRTIFPALRSVSAAPRPSPLLTPYHGWVTYGNLHENKWLVVSAQLRECCD